MMMAAVVLIAVALCNGMHMQEDGKTVRELNIAELDDALSAEEEESGNGRLPEDLIFDEDNEPLVDEDGDLLEQYHKKYFEQKQTNKSAESEEAVPPPTQLEEEPKPEPQEVRPKPDVNDGSDLSWHDLAEMRRHKQEWLSKHKQAAMLFEEEDAEEPRETEESRQAKIERDIQETVEVVKNNVTELAEENDDEENGIDPVRVAMYNDSEPVNDDPLFQQATHLLSNATVMDEKEDIKETANLLRFNASELEDNYVIGRHAQELTHEHARQAARIESSHKNQNQPQEQDSLAETEHEAMAAEIRNRRWEAPPKQTIKHKSKTKSSPQKRKHASQASAQALMPTFNLNGLMEEGMNMLGFGSNDGAEKDDWSKDWTLFGNDAREE